MRALPELEERLARANARSYTTASGKKVTSERYGTALTDGLFMSSRDGKVFHRWGEAFIRPGLRYTDNWVYGDNYQNWGLIETESDLPGAPDEISIYATEHYWRGAYTNLRRFILRVDGFVSVKAPAKGGRIHDPAPQVRRRSAGDELFNLGCRKRAGRDPGRRGEAHLRLCPGGLSRDLRGSFGTGGSLEERA